MDTAQNIRLKTAFEYLKENKKVYNQQDFTDRIKSDRSTISQALNNKIKIPKNLFANIVEAFPEISKDWLISGEGVMICPNINQKNVSGTNVVGENTVNNNNVASEFIDLLKKKDEQIEKKDEQIDRLLSMLEKLTNK